MSMQDQRKQVNHFFENFQFPEHLVDDILASDSTGIHVTGVGKSAFIAQKISRTLISVNVPARYLNAVEALHGDLGCVNEGDCIILFSKSGETKELIDLLPHLRARKAVVVSVTCSETSSLYRDADYGVYLPLLEELCPLDMAPTTSCVLQLLFADQMTVRLMNARGVTREAFARNHPSGQIGKRLVTRVSDLMVKDYPRCAPSTGIYQILAELVKGCGCVVVCDPGLIGVISDGDLRRAMLDRSDTRTLTASDLMTCKKIVRTAFSDELAYDVMERMANERINFVPVINSNDNVVGVFKLQDGVRAGL